MNDQVFSDNRRVKQGRNYADFLSLAIVTTRGGKYPIAYDIRISRYVCPSRMDYYSFELMDDGRIRYSSEQNEPLAKGLASIQSDLNMPQIKEMIERIRGMNQFEGWPSSSKNLRQNPWHPERLQGSLKK